MNILSYIQQAENLVIWAIPHSIPLPSIPSPQSEYIISTAVLASTIFAAAMLIGASMIASLTCAAISAIILYVDTRICQYLFDLNMQRRDEERYPAPVDAPAPAQAQALLADDLDNDNVEKIEIETPINTVVVFSPDNIEVEKSYRLMGAIKTNLITKFFTQYANDFNLNTTAISCVVARQLSPIYLLMSEPEEEYSAEFLELD